MDKLKAFARQLHWKIFLIRILVNGAALALTAIVMPDIYFIDRSFRSIVIVSIGLGILNAIVKPVILLLTGQFIFVTFGFLVILVNALMLFLLQRFFPSIIAVTSIFWALVGGAVLGLVSNALENLMGLTPPIVPAENVELRKRIEAGQPRPLVSLVGKPQTIVQHDVETQSVSEFTAAKAALEVLKVAPSPAVDTAQPSGSSQPQPDGSKIPIQELPVDDKTDPTSEGAA